jgi:hypothetical protein
MGKYSTTKVRFLTNETVTNISLGSGADPISIEALVTNDDLVPQIIQWFEHVPASIRKQVFNTLCDNQAWRDELANMLEEE